MPNLKLPSAKEGLRALDPHRDPPLTIAIFGLLLLAKGAAPSTASLPLLMSACWKLMDLLPSLISRSKRNEGDMMVDPGPVAHVLRNSSPRMPLAQDQDDVG